jgi:hypothetical protein
MLPKKSFWQKEYDEAIRRNPMCFVGKGGKGVPQVLRLLWIHVFIKCCFFLLSWIAILVGGEARSTPTKN